MNVLVPLKNRVRAKQRLAPLLSSRQRRDLVWAMLQDMVVQLKQVENTEIILLTDDRAGRDLADELGINVMRDESGHAGDLNAVLEFAVQCLSADAHSSVAIMHADLPGLSADEIERLFATYARAKAPSLFVSPDHQGRGTNCLLFSVAHAPRFRFGEGSFARHCEQAQTQALALHVIEIDGLARDIDTPSDLEMFVRSAASHVANHTLTFLQSEPKLWRRLIGGKSSIHDPVAEIA